MKLPFALIAIFLYNNIVTNALNRIDHHHTVFHEDTQLSRLDRCHEDDIIDKIIDIFIPEDFDEGKDEITSEYPSFNESLKAINRLQEYSRNVSQQMSEFTKGLDSRFSEGLMSIDLPEECLTSLTRIMKAAKNGELWALKFFEAQPRPNNGLVELTGFVFGDYDQCLSIESPPEEDKPNIYGQYCGVRALMILDPKQYPPEVFAKPDEDQFAYKLANNLFPNSIKVQFRRTYQHWLYMIEFLDAHLYEPRRILNGLCLPSTCKPREVSKAVTELIYPLIHYPLVIDDDCEYTGKPIQLNTHQIVSIIGLGSLFVVFLLSSIVDSFPKTSVISKSLEKTSLGFCIKCFSVKRNAKTVFSLKQYSKFKSLDGFRAILTFFVVLLHNYEFGILLFFTKNHYLSAAYGLTQDYRNMFLPNILLMDNFFLISAFLLGNTMFSKLAKSKGKFNYLNYLLYRYLRMLPIILCGLFLTYLFELFGDGPIWHFVKLYFIGPCYDKWHKPLLMYNNMLYYTNENSTVLSSVQCMIITWYASCDFQLYALAPIAFLFLYKSAKYGVIWNIGLLVLAVISPPFIRFVFDFPHIYELFKNSNYQSLMIGWGLHYWGPINYLQTYIIGILLAYLVRHKPDLYLGGRFGEILIGTTSVCVTLLLMYWQRLFITANYPFEALYGYELHVYLLIHKLAYLPFFIWLIFICCSGRGGLINEILGWKGFKIVDNLMLEIYILHIFAFVYRGGVRRELITITDYYVWTCAVFDFVATYVLSIVVALVVTRPFGNMTLALLKPRKKKPRVLTQKTMNGINPKTKSLDNELDNEIPYFGEKDIKLLNVIHYSNDLIVYRL